MKQNELFNKCCDNCDPNTREEVWKQMDKELGRTELEQAAAEWVNSLSDGTYGILDAFKAGAEWQRRQFCERDYIKGFNAAIERIEVDLQVMRKK